ncbi:hypothetical protein EJB05_38629 [Eragrostis curvula]|uniref:Armadillo-like repeats domain-containing protein n=1 Tax=Eragrostis curvula TaxID=38414 RepID=A0A5J9TUT3_9POAL|nr:hypothetical protein EJB05_38629 [Eragrostis curvula]
MATTSFFHPLAAPVASGGLRLRRCPLTLPIPARTASRRPAPLLVVRAKRTDSRTPAAASRQPANPSAAPKEEEVEVEEEMPWIQDKALDLVEFTGTVTQAIPGPRVGSSPVPWLLAVPLAYVGVSFVVAVVRTVRRFTSPRTKKKRRVGKNIFLLKSLDELFQKGREAVDYPALQDLMQKTGFDMDDVVRKYIRYTLNEKPFNPDVVVDLIHLRKASMLEDAEVAEILNEISRRIVREKGPVVMDLSGFTEQGFKRKLAVQALFGKIFYLSELAEFCSRDSSLVVKEIFGVTDEDADSIRIHTLSAAGDIESIQKMVDDSDLEHGKLYTDTGTPGGLVAVAIAHALALAAAVALASGASGGHVNPAVTFGVLVTRRISFGRAVLYWAAQLLGAVVAALLLRLVSGGTRPTGFGFGPGIHERHALLLEAVMTFGLMYTVYATAVDRTRGGGIGAVAPLAIGFVVGANILAGGPFDGAAMNPARAFGPALVGWSWRHHWVYWVGPLIGAGLAGALYEYVMVEQQHEAPAAAAPRMPLAAEDY